MQPTAPTWTLLTAAVGSGITAWSATGRTWHDHAKRLFVFGVTPTIGHAHKAFARKSRWSAQKRRMQEVGAHRRGW